MPLRTERNALTQDNSFITMCKQMEVEYYTVGEGRRDTKCINVQVNSRVRVTDIYQDNNANRDDSLQSNIIYI